MKDAIHDLAFLYDAQQSPNASYQIANKKQQNNCLLVTHPALYDTTTFCYCIHKEVCSRYFCLPNTLTWPCSSWLRSLGKHQGHTVIQSWIQSETLRGGPNSLNSTCSPSLGKHHETEIDFLTSHSTKTMGFEYSIRSFFAPSLQEKAMHFVWPIWRNMSSNLFGALIPPLFGPKNMFRNSKKL